METGVRETIISKRQEVRLVIVSGMELHKDIDIIMAEIDPIIYELVGEDDTDTIQMPIHWNQALKKQYINFRNHLRRSMRAKWGL